VLPSNNDSPSAPTDHQIQGVFPCLDKFIVPPGDEIPTTSETIQDLAGMMNYCENSEMLAAVRSLPGMTRKLWQAAGRLLSQQKRQELAKWMQQLFNSGHLQPSSA
jgi:hypothetical protein